MKRSKIGLLAILIVIITAVTAYAVEPTQEEMDAFRAAMDLYMQSQVNPLPPELQDPPPDPAPPTPEELKQQAISAFNDFITAYPESEINPSAQYHIARCYYELEDYASAKTEYNKVVTGHSGSDLVDDALYFIAYIDYATGDYETALSEFDGLITDYEGNANDNLTHKVPFAYFMVGECHRKLNDMVAARSKYNELIVKYPTHSQAGRAKKRLNQ